jgi:hypothetical protein
MLVWLASRTTLRFWLFLVSSQVFCLLLLVGWRVRGYTAPPPPPLKIWNVVDIPSRLAKFEPVYGCYIGAYIDLDPSIKSMYKDLDNRPHREPEEFEKLVGKPHAMYFFYLGYGKKMPTDWVMRLGDQGKFAHIALEPNWGLSKVKEDDYLRGLADAIRSTGVKVFLRFGSEMNGDWTHYGGNPRLYIEKFRLVAKVMHERAPNVAMVWCPYATPVHTIPRYFPGDDAVDWVGVNIYNVIHHDNNRRRIATHESPTSLLDYVYKRYSDRKPIMIGEYGATHRSTTMRRPWPEYAVTRIRELYAALPKRYPRVKCINYFSGNNIEQVEDRAYNDYSVTNDSQVLAAYKQAISSSYFLTGPLGDVGQAATVPTRKDEITVWVCPETGATAGAYCTNAVPRELPAGLRPPPLCRAHRLSQ